jgi:DNA-binding CsgD family transcriptional regulator
MQLKAVILQSRKAIVTRRFGAEAWAGLFYDVASAHSCFTRPLSHTSLLPLSAFLAFHDELMRRFFRDDDESHRSLGREAARWTMTEGPLRTFMKRRDLAAMVTALPSLWKIFFVDEASYSEAALDEAGVHFRVHNLREHHRYFDSLVVAYTKEILEMFCVNSIAATKIRGSRTGYHYLFHFTPPPQASTKGPMIGPRGEKTPDVRRRAREVAPALSDREVEVLLLAAEGKTNDEIGSILGISGKTAQHHLTSTYGKIGVTGRVGATLWLAQQRLIGD